jgi:hypothetical protein
VRGIDEANESGFLQRRQCPLHAAIVVANHWVAFEVWLQAVTSALRLSGYCCGVVSCFSMRQPITRPCSRPRRTS